MALVVAHSVEEWIASLGHERMATAMTIGNFDGVHRGHQTILARAVEQARASALMPAVLTFHPHPARVLRPAVAPPLLMTLEQRLRAFESAGIASVLVLRFDESLAKVNAEDFVRRFLVDGMRARAILVGGNFRFGHKQAGDVKLLGQLGERHCFHVEVVPPVVEDGIVVSSTAVRNAVRDGRMEDATKFLGRPFALGGEIRTGTGQGRKLVVPTLNLGTEQEALPKRGVYATESLIEQTAYRSVTNVGVRPTFDGRYLAIESHLFDFNETRSAGPMEVRFFTRLRDEQKFSGADALRAQVLRDIANAKEYFAAEQKR
jgi:riboflavin kinase/FMN adenylyltransferase